MKTKHWIYAVVAVAIMLMLGLGMNNCKKRGNPLKFSADSTSLAKQHADSIEAAYEKRADKLLDSWTDENNNKLSSERLLVYFYDQWQFTLSQYNQDTADLATCNREKDSIQSLLDVCNSSLADCQTKPAPVKKKAATTAAPKPKAKKAAPAVSPAPPTTTPGSGMSPELAAEIAARKAAAKQTPATPYNLSLKGIAGIKVEPACITVSESGYPLYCIKDEIFQMSPHTINAPIHGGDASGGTYTLGLDGWWTYEDRSYGKLTIGEIKNKVFHWCIYIGENTQYGTPFPMHLPLEIVKKWGFEDILKKPGVYPSVWGNGIFWDRSNTGPSHGEGHEFRDMVHYTIVPE